MNDNISKQGLVNWLVDYRREQNLATANRIVMEIIQKIDSNKFDIKENKTVEKMQGIMQKKYVIYNCDCGCSFAIDQFNDSNDLTCPACADDTGVKESRRMVYF